MPLGVRADPSDPASLFCFLRTENTSCEYLGPGCPECQIMSWHIHRKPSVNMYRMNILNALLKCRKTSLLYVFILHIGIF